MKALVKKYSKPGLILEEMPIPELGTNDILIKVLKTSICGTDIHIYQWDKWAQNNINTPLIITEKIIAKDVSKTKFLINADNIFTGVKNVFLSSSNKRLLIFIDLLSN